MSTVNPRIHTTRRLEVDWQRYWPVFLALIGMGLAGVLLLTSWKYFLAGCGGLVLGTLVVLRPRLGFYLTVASVPLEAIGKLGNLFKNFDLSIAKIMALLTIGAWLAWRRQ